MKKDIRERITEYIRNKRKRNQFLAILSVLSFVVLLGTFYTLSMPALTMDKDLTCGLEEHTHTEACYDEAGNLICGLPEHTHSDACYKATPTPVATAEPTPAPAPSPSNVAVSPLPSVSPGPEASVNPEASDTVTLPSPSASTLPSPSVSPSASASVSPSPSASPSPSPSMTISGQQYMFSGDDLEVGVTLGAPNDLPEGVVLDVVRITHENHRDYHTISMDDIESTLGVSKQADFEYYLLRFTDGENYYSLPSGDNTITITDNRVGKKYGAKAVFGVFSQKEAASVFAANPRDIATENQSTVIRSSTAASGFVVCWFNHAVKAARVAAKSEETKAAKEEVKPEKSKAPKAGAKPEKDEGERTLAPESEDDEYAVLSAANQNQMAASTKKEAHKTDYTYRANGITATAKLSSADAVPDEADLVVSRITREDDFFTYLNNYLVLIFGEYIAEGQAFDMYDIQFSLDGEEIEPTHGEVDVTLEDTQSIAARRNNVSRFRVLHIDDRNHVERLSADAPGLSDNSQVNFSVGSFSTFITVPVGSSLTFDLVDEISQTFPNTAYYNSSRPLGMAGNFHIVAFDTARLQAHTNGNVLTKNLYASSNFGTNNLPIEVSYIENYLQVASTSATSNDHVLALGSTNTITLMDNGNAFGVNGTKLDRPKNILQDDDSDILRFVNINLVEAELRSIALTYSSMTDTNIDSSHLNPYAGNCETSYVQLSNPDSVGVYNTTASAISQYSYFGIKGFTTGGTGTVVVNVDCTGYTGTVNLPHSEMFKDGTKLNFAEVTNFVNGHILWNFINCTTTVETGLLYGTIVAPDATVNARQNVNGTIIGKNVTIYAESHRDDFVGDLTDNLTVGKVWLDTDDSPLSPAEVADMSVTLQLYRNHAGHGFVAYRQPVTLTAADSWTYSWINIPGGDLYEIREISVEKNGVDASSIYSTSYSSNNGNISTGYVYVYNKIVYTLPDTGGRTQKPLIIAGILMMGAALIIFLNLKPTQNNHGISDTG